MIVIPNAKQKLKKLQAELKSIPKQREALENRRVHISMHIDELNRYFERMEGCLLYTSDAADE